MLSTASSVAAKQAKQAVRASGARSIFAKASAMPAVGLDEEFPSVPATSPAPAAAGKVTRGEATSGLKLASDDRAAPVATLGIQLKAGSRYESDETAGTSALFSKMAFRATEARSDLRLYRAIESIGGVVSTFAGRESLRYTISVLPDQLDAAAAILAETTLAPRFAHWDIDAQKALVRAERERIDGNPSALVLDNLLAAAFYDDATLGRSVFSTDNLANLDSAELVAFYEQFVNTGNAALIATGVEQSKLADIANEHFSAFASGPVVTPAAAQYVGGESRVKVASKFTQVALGFPVGGRGSADYGASHVLRALLGLRLKSKKASAFLSSYQDAGLVGFSGYAAPEDAGALVSSFIDEVKKAAAAPPTKEELAAAKAAAAFEALDKYATREGQLTLVGFAAHAPADYALKTPLQTAEAVTATAVQDLAKKALASVPSVAAIGKLSAVPHLDAVIKQLK